MPPRRCARPSCSPSARLPPGICSTAAAYTAAAAHVPGGSTLLAFTVVWNAVSTIVTAIKPKGDYAKALRALRTR